MGDSLISEKRKRLRIDNENDKTSKNHINTNSEQAVDDISTQEFSLGSMDYSCDNESIQTVTTKNMCQLQLAKSRSDTSCSLVAETQDNANDSIDEVENTSEADPYFNFFYCGGSRDHTFTCYKFMPATGADGLARFDTDSTGVLALKFVSDAPDAEGTGVLTTESITLTGALAGAQATVALVAGVLALSFQ